LIPTVNVQRPVTTINCPVFSGIVKPNIISEDLFTISPSAEIEVKCPNCKIIIDIDKYCEGQRTIIEENLDNLPPLLNDSSEPFNGLNHLNVIYKESYYCIANGFYHSGIVLMSQLLEETLREIITIHTGTRIQGTFEYLLAFAEGKGKNSPQPFLLHPIITEQLIIVKERIRNPYRSYAEPSEKKLERIFWMF